MSKKRKFILGFVLGFVLFLVIYSPVILFNAHVYRGHYYELWAGPWFELKYFLLSSATIISGAVGGFILFFAALFVFYTPALS